MVETAIQLNRSLKSPTEMLPQSHSVSKSFSSLKKEIFSQLLCGPFSQRTCGSPRTAPRPANVWARVWATAWADTRSPTEHVAQWARDVTAVYPSVSSIPEGVKWRVCALLQATCQRVNVDRGFIMSMSKCDGKK
ncbi:hypothetical protein J6590_022885 [Homalodisca vitripennis]|nr:hypothetical protein J6590_022885 [Homalodisca vitripennis]